MALIEKLENIGDAIRNKTGKTDLLTLDEMVTEIGNIETGGGSGDLDWSAIGYEGTPEALTTDYDYALQIKNNWVSPTTCANKFNSDYNLSIMPLVDTSKSKSFERMFYHCYGLFSVPVLDTSNSTSFSNMFAYCYGIKNIPKINTSKGTTFYNMFNSCSCLESIPDLDTSQATDLGYMFSGCSRLVSVPNFNTSNLTSLNNTFYNCKKIETLPELDCGKLINIYNTFGLATAIKNMGGFTDLGKGFTQRSVNYNNYKLTLSGCNSLTYESLMNVINKLYDLNITYGVAEGNMLVSQGLVLGSTNIAKLTADEIAIATAKGWTVS